VGTGRRAISRLNVLVLVAFAGSLAVPAVALAAGGDCGTASAAAARSVRWGCLVGLAVVIGLLGVGWLLKVKLKTLFIGADDRVSTSKTVAASWTLIVAAVLMGMVYASFLGHGQALCAMDASGIVGQYAVLFGGPLGAAILAKQIVNTQTATVPRTPSDEGPKPRDLIADAKGNTDLGDLQYVLFNLVAFVFVIGTLMHSPLTGLPHIPDVLLGLTSVSAVGYVGKKALAPPGPAVAKLTAATGPLGAPVTIDVTGLLATQTFVNALVQFGKTNGAGQIAVHADAQNGTATLTATPAAALAAGALDVTVVMDDGTVLNAGTYTLT
jgi:hypothetical protein